MILISFSRFHHTRHGIPCPELFFLASTFLPHLYFPHFLNSSRIHSLDWTLWLVDKNFGRPEVALAAYFLNHHLAGAVIRLLYWAIPLAGVIVYLALPNSAGIRRKFCIASGCGSLLLPFYGICPAAGPVYLFGNSFPYGIPTTDPTNQVQWALPHGGCLWMNCAPSGHVAWALVMFWFARRYCGKAAQTGAAAFLLSTCLATLALGEHYFIDLILALPFAAGLYLLADRMWMKAAVSWTVTLAWLFAIRAGWAVEIPSYIGWALCFATLIGVWIVLPPRLGSEPGAVGASQRGPARAGEGFNPAADPDMA